MASASPRGGNDNTNDLSIVYRAVCDGASVEQVRAILAGGPRTRARSEWIAAVVNHKNSANGATAFQRAHGRRDGPLVGLLLEHGADPRVLGPNANALAICIAYGQVDCLRSLLRSGRYSPDEEVAYFVGGTVEGEGANSRYSCRLVHLCLVPPRLSNAEYDMPPPQLECLTALVREFGADVNKQDKPNRLTPLHWLPCVPSSDEQRAFDALMALGPDMNVRNSDGRTYIFGVGDPNRLQQILARGASADVVANNGWTPLLRACAFGNEALVSALLPHTSTETRRCRYQHTGYSDLDYLVARAGSNPEPWQQRAIDGLLSSRAAKRNRSGAMQWRAHEDLSGLAMDFQELREAEARVEERERRVAELEEELRRRGIEVGEDEDDEEASGEGAAAAN